MQCLKGPGRALLALHGVRPDLPSDRASLSVSVFPDQLIMMLFQ